MTAFPFDISVPAPSDTVETHPGTGSLSAPILAASIRGFSGSEAVPSVIALAAPNTSVRGTAGFLFLPTCANVSVGESVRGVSGVSWIPIIKTVAMANEEMRLQEFGTATRYVTLLEVD